MVKEAARGKTTSFSASTAYQPDETVKRIPKPKSMRSYKIFVMDGTEIELQIDKIASAQELFEKVVQTLNILEKDYFGLSFLDASQTKLWLQADKKVIKQMKKPPFELTFEVKFYPPEPDQLQEDVTRYYLCLQVRGDVVSGKLACSPLTQALLGSYFVQAQLGDYDVDQNGPPENYLSEYKFAPQHSQDVLCKVHDLHKLHKGQTPSEAELHYLQNAKKLALYGVDLRPAKDSDNVDVSVAVCSSGILVYRDRLRMNRIAWSKILKICYRMNQFYVKVRPGEFEQRETVIGFKFPKTKIAKSFWKQCVEHHAFFRLMTFDAMNKKGTFGFGSGKYRFSGRTLYQSRLASGLIHRPEPSCQRSVSSRFAVKNAEPPKRLSDYKPAEVSSPLRFVDASSKDPIKTRTVPQSTVTLLTYQKSPDDSMPFEKVVSVQNVAPPSHHYHQGPIGEQANAPPSSSSTSHSSSDSTAVSKSDVMTLQQTVMQSEEIPVLILNDTLEHKIPIPISKTQQKLDKNAEKELKNQEKARQKFEKEAEKLRHKEEKLGKKSLTATVQLPPNFGDNILTDFYQLKIIPVEISCVQPATTSSIERTKSYKISPEKEDQSKNRIDETHYINGNPSSPLPFNNFRVLSFDQSGLQENQQAYHNGFENTHATPTPPTVSPKPHPKTVTTVMTNEESVHNVPARVMTMKGFDGAFTTTTTASQIKTVKQTIQTKSFETYSLPASLLQNSPNAYSQDVSKISPTDFVPCNEVLNEVTKITNNVQSASVPIPIPDDAKIVNVERKCDGNRTVETITYQIERDGVLETRTEHRVTVLSNSEIDYEQELSSAILAATQMNPKLIVEKVEIRRSNGAEV